MSYFALTIIGRDRPGIVAEVTRILYHSDCNLADSSSSILGGQFAMILIVSHPTFTTEEDFGDTFASLREKGLSVFLRALKPGGEIRPQEPEEICVISVYGPDRPGIVYHIAKELGDRQINIIDLNTKMVGLENRPVYIGIFETVLPKNITIENMEEVFNKIKKDLQLDITMRMITPVEL
jgi:glycine cleavage system transcriptional repressor